MALSTRWPKQGEGGLSDSGTAPGQGKRRSTRAVTMAEVARRAGVSSMTVSFVVNGRGGVRPEKERLVREAIAELGYVPNPMARALASGMVQRIAFLYEDAERAFLNGLVLGAVRATSALGIQLVLHECRTDLGAVRAAMAELSSQGVSGILLPAPFLQGIEDGTELAAYPVPFVGLSPGRDLPGLCAVGIDHFGAARAMTAGLIERGHGRIGFIQGDARMPAGITRLAGYRAALGGAGLAFDPALVVSGEAGYRAALAQAEVLLDLRHPPTAIFAVNDEMAAAVLSVAMRRGIQVPRQLAVAGFDDAPIAAQVWPALTTVRQPLAEIARKAVDLIQHAAEAQVRLEPGFTCLPYEIIERASTLLEGGRLG